MEEPIGTNSKHNQQDDGNRNGSHPVVAFHDPRLVSDHSITDAHVHLLAQASKIRVEGRIVE